ncbi:MAG: OmpA family protein [Bacteroidales bacterium]|nr:OmpA family protein [Bacteroidales bacterium]MDY2916958.1 OmpA family protein [Muribaculaceae bacterium]
MKPSTLLRALALSLCLAVSGAGLTAHAAPDSNDDLTLAQNIATPSAPSNASNALIRHAQGLGNYFIRKGYKVRYPRKGEVAEIIIPSDLLFLPNTAELRPDASKTLGLFKSLVERPQLYKLLVVAHTDNTGSPAYSDALTEDRAMAVFDFLVHLAPDIANNITPYGLGFDEPFDTGATVADSNASIAGRRANRRVEIYIVPTQQTIDMARNGKL